MDIKEQITLVKKAEDLGFASLFVRDSPLYDPNFGDAGVMYDPFMFIAYLTTHTNKMAIVTSSIITILRHTLHTAISAASVDRMTLRRYLLCTAPVDLPIDLHAFNVEYDERVELCQESIAVMRQAWKEPFPEIQTSRVGMAEGDMVPKPVLADIPILGTGFSGQTVEWLAEHTDGWMFYAQEANRQEELISRWHKARSEEHTS